jgi:hypothetical protein
VNHRAGLEVGELTPEDALEIDHEGILSPEISLQRDQRLAIRDEAIGCGDRLHDRLAVGGPHRVVSNRVEQLDGLTAINRYCEEARGVVLLVPLAFIT